MGKTVFIVFCLTFQIVHFMEQTRADLLIQATPSHVDAGLSASLDVTCTIRINAASSMAELLSLVISRANDTSQTTPETLATINDHFRDTSLLTSENITHFGSYDSVGETFIHLLWHYPNETQAGFYKCVAQGFDHQGDLTVMTNVAQVTVTQPTAQDWMEKTKQMVVQLNSLEQQMSDMKSYTRALEQAMEEMGAQMNLNMSTLDLFTKDLDEKLSETDNRTTNLELQMTVLDNRTNDLEAHLTEVGQKLLSVDMQLVQNVSGLLGYTKSLEMSFMSMGIQVRQNISDLDKFMKRLENNVTDIDNHTASLEDEVTQLGIQTEKNITELDVYAKFLTQRVVSLENEKSEGILGLFNNPHSYQDHKYYLSKYPFPNIDVAMAICKLYGGFLAEIDNSQELSAVKSYLNSHSGIDFVYIAGTDQAWEGHWVLPSGQSVPYQYWYSGQPNGGRDQNCLALWGGHSWNMCDEHCYSSPTFDERFLCEVSQT